MKFELDENDLKVISAALQEMPLKFALPVMQKMQKQINEQENPKEESKVA